MMTCFWVTLSLIIVFVRANIPHSFRIMLERDTSDDLRLTGVMYPEGRMRPRVTLSDSPRLGGFGQRMLELQGTENTRASVDVSDMISFEAPDSLQEFNIGYDTTLARSVDSIVYLNSPQGNQALILRPSNVIELARDGFVQYSNVQEGGFLLGKSMFSTMNISDAGPFGVARIDPTDTSTSTVSPEAFQFLSRAIRASGGFLYDLPGRWEVHVANRLPCRGLQARLPNLHFVFANEADAVHGNAQIVFTPNDYLVQTHVEGVCILDIKPGRDIRVSGFLARMTGGIHFDYANHRLGIFDPL